MSLFKDGNFIRTYEEQVEHLTKVHRIQLEINKKFKSFFTTNGTDIKEITEIITENDRLLVLDLVSPLLDYIPNAKIGDIYLFNYEKEFELICNISGVNGINGTDGEKGDTGDTGLSFLFSKYKKTSIPIVNQTEQVAFSYFNRIPVSGDIYIAFASSSGRTFLYSSQVTSIDAVISAAYSKILLVIETTGEKGEKGENGSDGVVSGGNKAAPIWLTDNELGFHNEFTSNYSVVLNYVEIHPVGSVDSSKLNIGDIIVSTTTGAIGFITSFANAVDVEVFSVFKQLKDKYIYNSEPITCSAGMSLPNDIVLELNKKYEIVIKYGTELFSFDFRPVEETYYYVLSQLLFDGMILGIISIALDNDRKKVLEIRHTTLELNPPDAPSLIITEYCQLISIKEIQ